VSGPGASSPPERASLLCGVETFWNSLADSVSSSFPSPQSRLAYFALPAEVSAKALTHPERDLEELGQFPLSFSPSPTQHLRSFGEVASKLFLPDVQENHERNS